MQWGQEWCLDLSLSPRIFAVLTLSSDLGSMFFLAFPTVDDSLQRLHWEALKKGRHFGSNVGWWLGRRRSNRPIIFA